MSFVTGHRALKAAAEARGARIASLLLRAGVVGNPYVISARALAYAIFCVPVFLGAGAVLAMAIWPPAFLVALVPALIYLFPELRLRDVASQRREGLERELPFFSILVSVLGGTGVPLYSIIVGTAGSKTFPRIGSEALLVKRDVEIFGVDPNEALERLIAGHPSRKFGNFVSGYTSKVRSGGDMASFLAGESSMLLRELEESWTRYVGRAGVVGSMMITVFGLLPLLLMVVGAFSPKASVSGLMIFAGVGVPLFTVVLVYMAGSMQPVGGQRVAGSLRAALVASAVGLVVFLPSGQLWISVGAGLIAFFGVYGYSVRTQVRTFREIDEALPQFLKDLLEYKRQEYDLTRSLLNIASANRYAPAFDRILASMAAQIRSGTPADELSLETRTSLSSLVFLMIGQMVRSGGGTVDTVFQISAYTEKVAEVRRNTMAEMKPYIVLSYVSPVLLAFGVSFVGGILGSFGSGASAGISALKIGGTQFGATTAAMTGASRLLIVVSAAALGIIASKMVDFTVKSTFRPCINVLIALMATLALSSAGIANLLRLVG